MFEPWNRVKLPGIIKYRFTALYLYQYALSFVARPGDKRNTLKKH